MAPESILEHATKTTTTTVREITPQGVTLEVNYTGEISGKLKAMSMGTTTIWMKTDGSSTWEDKLIANTHDGQMFVGMGKGTAKMMAGGKQEWSGESQMMSSSENLKWLNDKFKVAGVADPAKGGGSGKWWK